MKMGRREKWTKEEKMRYKKECEGGIGTRGAKTVDEEVEEVTEEIRAKIEKCRNQRKKKGMTICRIECELEEEYRRKDEKYGEICKKKKKVENNYISDAEKAKTDRKEWEIESTDKRRKYFMRLLEGKESGKVKTQTVGRKKDKEEELQRKEISDVIKRLKEGKIGGIDGIPNEAWKYGGEGIEEWVWKTCARIWDGEGWPESWKEGIIIPIRKIIDGKITHQYRSITLMPTMYKIYMTALSERLKEDIEKKNVIPQSQMGYKKGCSKIDAVYTLNYLINRQLQKENGKLIATFVDLKGAFDSVSRDVLWKAMESRGIRKGLIERVKEAYREVKCRMRFGKEFGKPFWTCKGIRQGCPLSPHLFNILIADLDETFKKEEFGGVKIEQEKICSLVYADDIVLLAEEENEMEDMISILEEYIDEKKLIVNVRKTEVVRFENKVGRMNRMDWRWNGKQIAEVQKHTFLGYVFHENGQQKHHVKEKAKKANSLLQLEEFKGDWQRELEFFDIRVWPVMRDGSEIWGWKERKVMERVHDNFLKWLLGLYEQTLDYSQLVREVLKRDIIRTKAGQRAWMYEDKLRLGNGAQLASKCRAEMIKREKRGAGLSKWEQERKRFFEERGLSLREAVERWEKGNLHYKELAEWDKKTMEGIAKVLARLNTV